MLTVNVYVKRLHPEAKVPKYMHDFDAAMDVYACLPDGPVKLYAGSRCLIPTGLAFEVPAGYELQIRPRSGLALKEGVSVLNSPGTLDSSYRGELGVILYKIDSISEVIAPFTVNHGDRIAQILVKPVPRINLIQVETLSETDRGEGGFGSTGK